MRVQFSALSCTLAVSIVSGGCSLTPPSRSPEDERTYQRARSQQREAGAAREQLQLDRAAASTERERLQAEIAALDAPTREAERAYREQQIAFEAYGNKIEAALAFADGCEEQDDPGTAAETGAALADGLSEFVSEPKRDEALKAMDRCRQHLVKEWRAQMKENVLVLQREFAIEIEDTFDENNPYSKGGLTAKVKGTTLDVRMRGNFEGRARHSQDQVDAWCARSNGLFTKIVLKNSHGTFACKPDDAPKDLIAKILEEANVGSSWVVVGDQPTPHMPDPPPVLPEVEQQRAELVAELQRLQSSAAEFDTRAAEIADQEQQAQQSVARVERRDKSRRDEWKQTKLRRASGAQVAGGVFTGIGGAILIGTVGASQSGVKGARDFVPIGVGISVPVIVSGILLLVGGGVRKNRVQQIR